MFIRDYDFIHNIEVLFEKKIIIYGAGVYGQEVALLLEDAGVSFYGFCDREEGGNQCLNHPVITISELQEKCNKEDCMIIVSSKSYLEEIVDDLEAKEISAYLCTCFGLQAAIELHVEDERFSEAFRTDFIQRREAAAANWMFNMQCECCMDLRTSPHAILIYQPGEVGASTVCRALLKEKIEAVQLQSLMSSTGTKILDEIFSYYLAKYKNGGVKIITLVREPISRALALFMECFQNTFVLKEEFEIKQCDDNYDLVECASKWMTMNLEENDEFLWFDRELNKVTGVDIYQHPFDKERGYTWIKEGNIEILLLKTEKLKENVAVIEEFVGEPGIELKCDYTGDERWTKFIFEELKRRIKLPARLLEDQYKDNWQLDHFYTEEEKEQFLQAWGEYTIDG